MRAIYGRLIGDKNMGEKNKMDRNIFKEAKTHFAKFKKKKKTFCMFQTNVQIKTCKSIS